VQPWESDDASSRHVWWSDAGVHQNIAFPVHPDPVDDDRTRAAAEPRPDPDTFAAHVDWSLAEVWGAGPAQPR
jgi:hypothetical protein